MSPKAVVERFLRAMSRLDIDAQFAELADDVVCAFPTAPGGPQEIRGRDTNRAFYTTTIRPMIPTFSLTRIAVHPLADDLERVVARSGFGIPDACRRLSSAVAWHRRRWY
jgi:ketosteroid isomerase-like protein